METLRAIFLNGAINYYFGSTYVNSETGTKYYSLPWHLAIPTFILILMIAYLFGSINFAMFISKKKFNEDIREHGSGNAGMTNMMRTYGKKAAFLTLLGDAVKTVIAVLIGKLLMGEAGAYVAGLGAVIGHTWPLYYNFKGGKGVVTAITMILCTEPIAGLILLLVFVAIVAMTKYISMGSIIGALMYPVILHNFKTPNIIELISCMGVVGLLVFNHRSNIKRLYNGKENKFSFKKSREEHKEE